MSLLIVLTCVLVGASIGRQVIKAGRVLRLKGFSS